MSIKRAQQDTSPSSASPVSTNVHDDGSSVYLDADEGSNVDIDEQAESTSSESITVEAELVTRLIV